MFVCVRNREREREREKRGFNLVWKNGNLLLNLFALMASSGIPGKLSVCVRKRVRQRQTEREGKISEDSICSGKTETCC
jgi:hypothetical protein